MKNNILKMKIYYLNLFYNLIFLLILIPKVKDKETVPIGTLYTKNITNSKIEFSFNSDKKLLIHILSIDCQIQSNEKNSKIVYEISNYNFNVLYFSITKKSYEVEINPLIDSIKMQKQNRNYHLIINSIKIDDSSNPPELTIIKNEPVFLYFKKGELEKIKLLYKFENSDLGHPIIISFFIKENIKFKIEISDNKNNIIITRNINYKENIIIKPEADKSYNILISSDELKEKPTMIVKVIQNNSTPFYLQKNQLNLGFIPIEIDYYYYYMEVFNGEVGEIMLYNKRKNGILKSKIIKKNKKNLIPKIKEFPNFDESDLLSNDYLEFNIYNQKLDFKSSQTKNCENGCFLLITYYSNISKSLDINGTEFSILSRIWDEEEFDSQINNIPLNEYVFGYFDEDTVNIHYYSVFIPYESNSIYIEMHGNNIVGFSKEGIVQINTYKLTNNTKMLFEECQEKMIITLTKKDLGLKSFKGTYISFAFEQFSNDYAYYYFRILQKNPEKNYTIYPLDTNKENYCETDNKKCHFLLKNSYNDLSNTIFIYGFGEMNTSYKVISMNYNDIYYSENSYSDKQEINEIGIFNDYFSFDLEIKDRFVLIIIEINSTDDKNLTVVSSLYNPLKFSSIDIYSYQLYFLNENSFLIFDLYQNPSIEYRILINITKGEGDFYFNQNTSFIQMTEKKIYSLSISNKKNFFLSTKNNLIFNIKIINEITNEAIKELNYQYNSIGIDENEDIFPLSYLIKDVKYKGININFNFKFNSSNNISDAYNNLIIKGYGLNYSEISNIKDKNDIKMIDFPNEIKGKYDNITNSGYIELSNQLIKSKYEETYAYTEDKYFFIIIDNITSFDFKNLKNEIYIISKDENYILPINKYIRNSFNLLGNQNINQKYLFEKENITNNELILEFSSNYDNIEITFGDLIKNNTLEINGGFKKYALSINSNNSHDYYFNLTIKTIKELNSENDLKEVNIIIKYYNENQKINADYICNKNFKSERINNGEKFSDFNLIINSKNEINNFPNDLNYNYYIYLIKKNEVLKYEQLNTISTVSSNLFYINKFETSEPNEEMIFGLNKLENNEEYLALLFIKVLNESRGEEMYYSMTYEFDTKKERSKILRIIISIIIIVLIIALILFFIIYRKMRMKNTSLENKVTAISFSSGINQDLINNRDSDKSKNSEDYENTFI